MKFTQGPETRRETRKHVNIGNAICQLHSTYSIRITNPESRYKNSIVSQFREGIKKKMQIRNAGWRLQKERIEKPRNSKRFINKIRGIKKLILKFLVVNFIVKCPCNEKIWTLSVEIVLIEWGLTVFQIFWKNILDKLLIEVSKILKMKILKEIIHYIQNHVKKI
jgi:hypothetical protein